MDVDLVQDPGIDLSHLVSLSALWSSRRAHGLLPVLQEINLRLQRGEITAEDIAQVQEDDFSEEEPETGRDSWDDAEDSDADYVCSNAIQGFMAERIQKAFRAWKFRASVKLIRVFDIPKVGTLRWLLASKAVLLIQHAFREYCCHQYNIAVQDAQMTELRETRRCLAAMRIQRAYRHTVRRRLDHVIKYLVWRRLMSAAYPPMALARIQAAYRAHAGYVKYYTKRMSAKIIQRWYRVQAAAWRQKVGAAVTLQKISRANAQRSKYLRVRSACMLIQSHARGFSRRAAYVRRVRSVRTIQRAVAYQKQLRVGRAKRQFLLLQKRRDRAARVLQRAIVHRKRKQVARKRRKQLVRERSAATTLQRYARLQLYLRKYHDKRDACMSIQCAYRARIRQKRRQRQRDAVVRLQSWSRRQLCEDSYATARRAATRIQRALRIKKENEYRLQRKSTYALKLNTFHRWIEYLQHRRWRKALATRVYALRRERAAKTCQRGILAWLQQKRKHMSPEVSDVIVPRQLSPLKRRATMPSTLSIIPPTVRRSNSVSLPPVRISNRRRRPSVTRTPNVTKVKLAPVIIPTKPQIKKGCME